MEMDHRGFRFHMKDFTTPQPALCNDLSIMQWCLQAGAGQINHCRAEDAWSSYSPSPTSSRQSGFSESSLSFENACYSPFHSPASNELTRNNRASYCERADSPAGRLFNRSLSLPAGRLSRGKLSKMNSSLGYRLNTSRSNHEVVRRRSCLSPANQEMYACVSPQKQLRDDMSQKSELTWKDSTLSSDSYEEFSELIETLFSNIDSMDVNMPNSDHESSVANSSLRSDNSNERFNVSSQVSEWSQPKKLLEDSDFTVDDWSLLHVYQLQEKQGSGNQNSFSFAMEDSLSSATITPSNDQSIFPPAQDSQDPAMAEQNRRFNTKTEVCDNSNNKSESESDLSLNQIPSEALYQQELMQLACYSQGEDGVYLLELLMCSAEAVTSGNLEGALEMLVRLKSFISYTGNTLQRVASYFSDGLECRLSSDKYPEKVVNSASSLEFIDAFELLHKSSADINFGYFTANQAILEAVEGKSRVHIVDYDILEGVQWASFMQALADRKGGVPHLTITTISRPTINPTFSSIQEVGKALAECAASFAIPFTFNIIQANNKNDMDHISLNNSTDEALVVNCMLSLLYLHCRSEDPSLVFSFLTQVRHKYYPTILTLLEDESTSTIPSVAGQIIQTLHYYCALFDSLASNLPSDMIDCSKVERIFLGDQIRSALLSIKGNLSDHSSRRRRRSEAAIAAGFKPTSITAYNVRQSKMLLELLFKDGYSVKENKNQLTLTWKSKMLTTFSSWI